MSNKKRKESKLPVIQIFEEEREEIKKNIDWFSRLDPIQKIRAVEINNRATWILLNGKRKFRRSH